MNKSRYSNMKSFLPPNKFPMNFEIDNSINLASFHMNSPTKPFNLLNIDIINRYNLDDEFSDSESVKSSLPQITLIKKQTSPKIKIVISTEEDVPHLDNINMEKINENDEENNDLNKNSSREIIDNIILDKKEEKKQVLSDPILKSKKINKFIIMPKSLDSSPMQKLDLLSPKMSSSHYKVKYHL